MSDMPDIVRVMRELGGGRVRVVRRADGTVVGFQDPDEGSRFISREQALKRVTFDNETGLIVDSFDNSVGPGALHFPRAGIVREYRNAIAEFELAPRDVLTMTPDSNQEIVERITFKNSMGRLETLETSYGQGQKYDRSKFGGRFRKGASDALGLGPGERLITSDLERAIVSKEFLLRKITPK